MGGRRRRPSNAPGAHYLADHSVAAELVRQGRVCTGDLVLDLGAGAGALTGPLLRAGAHVVAVERDQRLSARLRRRFEAAQITVVSADLLAVPLPRRPYRVVASIPFAITTPLLGRLLDPWHSSLQRAALVVEWGAAKRLSARRTGDPRIVWWGARYHLHLARRIKRDSFSPPPQVDAGLLVAERRPVPLVSSSARAHYLGLVVSTLRTPRMPIAEALAPIFSNRQMRRLLRDHDLDHHTPIAGLSLEQWASMTATMMAIVDRHRWPQAKPHWSAR